jgi:uncharacterized membrane protein
MLGFRTRHALSRRLWVIPLLGIVAGAALSVVTVAIDRHLHATLVPQRLVGSPSDATAILSTIATAVVTLTSIVLTITLVAIQLAMGQFSPRIVRALLDDRGNQVAVALFGGTFTFAIFSLRAVGTAPGADPTPGVTVVTAFALVAASAAALVMFVHHAAQQLRVGGLIDLVGDELRTQLDNRYRPAERRAPNRSVITSNAAGNLIHVDDGGLVELARRADCALELLPMMGDFLMRGSPLVRIHGDAGRLDARAIRSRVVLDDERTHDDDPAYGFRKLVDVAQRALGTSSNDATSAVQVVNRLHDCLRQIADRPLPSGVHRDRTGAVRLTVRTLTWDGYVRLAFDEIRLAGAGYPQVTRRICAAIQDLKTVAPDHRHAALDRQLRLLAAGVRRALDDEEDVRAALVPDAQGLGSGADVVDGESPLDASSAVQVEPDRLARSPGLGPA